MCRPTLAWHARRVPRMKPEMKLTGTIRLVMVRLASHRQPDSTFAIDYSVYAECANVVDFSDVLSVEDGSCSECTSSSIFDCMVATCAMGYYGYDGAGACAGGILGPMIIHTLLCSVLFTCS